MCWCVCKTSQIIHCRYADIIVFFASHECDGNGRHEGKTGQRDEIWTEEHRSEERTTKSGDRVHLDESMDRPKYNRIHKALKTLQNSRWCCACLARCSLVARILLLIWVLNDRREGGSGAWKKPAMLGQCGRPSQRPLVLLAVVSYLCSRIRSVQRIGNNANFSRDNKNKSNERAYDRMPIRENQTNGGNSDNSDNSSNSKDSENQRAYSQW